MAHQADSELECSVVGLAVLSTPLSLRVGEAASISFHRLGVLARTAEFYDRKVHRPWITRTVSGVALKWLQLCACIAQRCWNLDKFQRRVSEDKVQNVMATLLRGSKWKDLRWHAWRRLGRATMYKAGGKIPSIKAWFRWRSTRTAMAYINCLHPGRIRHPFTTPTPPVTSRGSHGLREQQPRGVRNSGLLRPTISLRRTPQRVTLEIPRALGHPRTAPHLGRPMAGGVRGDAAREEAAGRTDCGVVGEGGESMQVSPGNRVGGQHKPRRMKSLMGVGGGRAAGAWVTCRRARACAWSALRRVEQFSDIPWKELFRAALVVILRARERLTDVDGGQAHLEKILSHMEALHELNRDLLGQDYDGYDGDGPSEGISEGMIAAGLGERGSLDIPLDVWNANIPTRLIWDIRSLKSGPDRGRFDVWQPSLHTRRMIGVLVDDGFLCRDPECLGAPEWEDLTDNVSAFAKPKNYVKCSFIIDMRNLNECLKVPLRKVKLPSIHTVFQTIQREIHRGAPLWGITLDISIFYWSLQIPAAHRGLFRIQGAHFHCLPFGWKFSPVLAHDTLAALLREFSDNHAVGLDIHRFHYLDDALILSRDRECMDSLGPRLAAFLMAKGLRISTKSCLKPHQNVLWLGKVCDLAKGEVRNTDKMLTKCLGIAIKTACSPVSPKVAERVDGKMQWAFGPRKGVALFLQGWHRFRCGRHRFQPGPDIGAVRCAGNLVCTSHG